MWVTPLKNLNASPIRHHASSFAIPKNWHSESLMIAKSFDPITYAKQFFGNEIK